MFGLGKKVDVFLCPAVQGQITMNGEPVAGLEITRELSYDGNFKLDYTRSSDSGHFSFDEVTTRSRTPNKPFVEARTRQVLIADYQGQRYVLWFYVTDDIREEPVISDKLRNLKCDFSSEDIYQHIPIPDKPHLTYNISGICRWE